MTEVLTSKSTQCLLWIKTRRSRAVDYPPTASVRQCLLTGAVQVRDGLIYPLNMIIILAGAVPSLDF